MNSLGSARDEDGDGCAYYEKAPEDCGEFDDSDFSAIGMCCICGEPKPKVIVRVSRSMVMLGVMAAVVALVGMGVVRYYYKHHHVDEASPLYHPNARYGGAGNDP